MAARRTIRSFEDLCALVADRHAEDVDLFVRFSDGPAADRRMGASTNHQTGRPEAGLSVNNLVNKHGIWEAGHRGFTAMNLREYAHFGPVAYLLTGTTVGEGSDGEPIVADWIPVATVAPAVVEEAKRIYDDEGI